MMIGCNIDLRKAEIKADNRDYGQLAAPNTATTGLRCSRLGAGLNRRLVFGQGSLA